MLAEGLLQQGRDLRDSQYQSLEKHSLECLLQVMTNIGAVCLITIGVWIVIELAVQFGKYHHRCVAGISEFLPSPSNAALRATGASSRAWLLAG